MKPFRCSDKDFTARYHRRFFFSYLLFPLFKTSKLNQNSCKEKNDDRCLGVFLKGAFNVFGGFVICGGKKGYKDSQIIYNIHVASADFICIN